MARVNSAAELERTVAHARTLLGLGASGRAVVDVTARTVAVETGAAKVAPRVRAPLPTLEVKEGLDAEIAVSGTLGEGGMGVVLLARQRSLERDVALKRLKPEHATDATHVASLLDEAVTTGALEHPAIVPVHALGRDETGRPVLVMKRVEGVPLSRLVHDPGHAGWARVRGDREVFLVETAMKLADALAFAHSRGVVHRDVKPDNVMIGEYGEVVLLDWGIAGKLGEHATSIAGTPVYMAPEMLRPGAAPLDARTDVYLLGATLHECVVGAPPHRGETLEAVLLSIARSDPFEYGDAVPSDLAAILRRTMAADPADRPASMSELRELLREHLEHRAAARLAAAARLRLAELEALTSAPTPDAVAVHAAFHACRFGLEEALKSWPDNERARTDRRRALEVMARFEIGQKNRGAAAALLAALDPPPPELESALAALDARLSVDAGERARLERIDRDLDQTVSGEERVRVARAVGAIMAVASVAFVALRVYGTFEPTAPIALLMMMPLVVLAIAVTYVGRKAFFRNRVNRHITLTLLTAMVAVIVERVGAVSRGHSVEEIVAADALIIATAAMMAAWSIRRLYTIPAVAFALASLVAALAPGTTVFPALVAGAITVVSFAVLRHRLRSPWLDAFDRPSAGEAAAGAPRPAP